MTPEPPSLSTRLLSMANVADFERLFENRPAPDAFDCWCLFNHGTGPYPPKDRPSSEAARVAANRMHRRALVERGLAHGVLVYAGNEPVGWCQFGAAEELPRFDESPNYRTAAGSLGSRPLWRITCFTVDQRYRGQGVARTALQAALEAIRANGGGLVEAYPVIGLDAPGQYLGSRSLFEKAGFEVVAPLGTSNLIMRMTL